MKIEDLRAYFENARNFVEQTSFGRTCWFDWQRKGYVPIKSQFRIEEITEGKLKANFEDAGKK